MLYDHRTYRVKPGTLPDHLKLYAEMGRETQIKHLGEPVFYGVVETGAVNTYVHIWQYENAGDREKRRAAMQADPQWQAYLKASREAGWLIQQDNKLMSPAPFFKPRA